MKQLKLISLLTVLVMLLGALAACGTPATPAAQPTAAAAQPAAATEAPKATEVPQPTAVPAEAAKKITIASDAAFPPMEFVDTTKAIVGFDIDLIQAIAKDQKFEAEIKNTAWDGIFAGLEGGAYDAILSSVTITEDRKKNYDFSDPYFDANQAIVVRVDDATIATEADLAGKPVGAQIGTTGAIYVGDNLKEATLKQYDTADLAMMDLLNKQVEAVVIDTPVAANFALQAEQFKGKLKIASEIVTEEQYALTVQKGDPKGLLPLFNAGLANVKASGDYDKIYEKWIGAKPGTAAEAPAEGGNQAVVTDTSYSAVDCDYGGIIKSIEALDDLTVKFTLCSSDVAFPSKIAFSAFQIHPSEYLESTGGGGDALISNPIGTGPYKLEKWQRGDSVIMTRNEDYWGEQAKAETLVFRWQKEGAARPARAAVRHGGRHRQPHAG